MFERVVANSVSVHKYKLTTPAAINSYIFLKEHRHFRVAEIKQSSLRNTKYSTSKLTSTVKQVVISVPLTGLKNVAEISVPVSFPVSETLFSSSEFVPTYARTKDLIFQSIYSKMRKTASRSSRRLILN